MSTITITRALTELKTLDKRIQKEIDGGVFVSYQGQFCQPSPYAKSAGATYQSINDLLERRKRIKSMIISSNANTTVKICGKEMSVAEAIETKSSLKHYKNLLATLKRQYGEANRNVENLNARVRHDLETKTTRSVEGGGNSGNVGEKMDVVDFSKKYMDMHGVKLYDPIAVSSRIEELENYISNFENEVDYVLAEKNSVTTITV